MKYHTSKIKTQLQCTDNTLHRIKSKDSVTKVKINVYCIQKARKYQKQEEHDHHRKTKILERNKNVKCQIDYNLYQFVKK